MLTIAVIVERKPNAVNDVIELVVANELRSISQGFGLHAILVSDER